MSAPKRRHHYVPKFYLRRFSLDGRRINLWNFRQARTILGASLKHQCYGRRFYESDQIENDLANLEAEFAPALARIDASHRPPVAGSDDHGSLLLYVTLQRFRTPSAAQGVEEMSVRMLERVYRHHPVYQSLKRAGLEAHLNHASLRSLVNLESAILLSDLGMIALETSLDRPLISSDNPVAFYNKYLEPVTGFGRIGLASPGLIVYLPLSPSAGILMFDRRVYKERLDQPGCVRYPTDRDIRQLNLLQAINAEDNLYFHRGSLSTHVERLARSATRFRGGPRTISREYAVAGTGGRERLLASFETSPNIGLQLSFLEQRASARSVPVRDRVRRVRPIIRLVESERPPDMGPVFAVPTDPEEE